MKDKEFDAKLTACLLGKEKLFDEVVDGLAEKSKKSSMKQTTGTNTINKKITIIITNVAKRITTMKRRGKWNTTN